MAGLWAVWKDPETGLWVPSAAVTTGPELLEPAPEAAPLPSD
jgi:hypothetical protein